MSLLEKIFLGTREDAFTHILEGYQEHGWYVISFLYFANVMRGRLLEEPVEEWHKNYRKAIENANILLADGIALQLFYRRGAVGRRTRKTPYNLNGTDFNPWFLEQLLGLGKLVHIGLYTLYDDTIGKPASFIDIVQDAFGKQFGKECDFVFQAPYAERMHIDFPFEQYAQSVQESNYEYRVLLMSTGTPAQEIRVENHKQKLQELGILVINAGGTIDYIAGFEKRAPKRVIKARVLETPWRVMQHPKKNFKKFASMFGIIRYWVNTLYKEYLAKK